MPSCIVSMLFDACIHPRIVSAVAVLDIQSFDFKDSSVVIPLSRPDPATSRHVGAEEKVSKMRRTCVFFVSWGERCLFFYNK